MRVRIGESEARVALGMVEQQRRQVLAEVGVPFWYWAFLAAGWVLLGAIADFAAGWVISVSTLVFGAAHSVIAPRVISGREGSRQLSIRRELVGRQIPTLILAFVLVMAVVTVAFGLLLHGDGDRHPSLFAGVVVGLLVLTGGPSLVAVLRRRAQGHP